MSEKQPCEKYLDAWRVGLHEWLKVPEGSVCPRCGFLKEEHQPTSPPQDETPAQNTGLGPNSRAGVSTLKGSDETPQGDLQRRIARWLYTPISSTKPERLEGDTVALVQDAAAEIARLTVKVEETEAALADKEIDRISEMSEADHQKACAEAAEAENKTLQEAVEANQELYRFQLSRSAEHERVILTLRAELEQANKELALVREAAHDQSLSDAAARVVAAGLQEPTADDITWALEKAKERS